MMWLWIVAGVVMFDVVLFGVLWLIDRRHYRRAGKQLAALEAAAWRSRRGQRRHIVRGYLPAVAGFAFESARRGRRCHNTRQNATLAWPRVPGTGRLARQEAGSDCAASARLTQIRECRVPIWDDLAKTREWSLYGNALSWMTVLLWATHNDLGEGRIDSAIRSWQSLNGLARHLYQQPSLCHRIFAILIESQVFLSLSPFLVNAPDCSDDRLSGNRLHPAAGGGFVGQRRCSRQIARVEKLLGLKRTGYMPLVERLKKRIRPDPSLSSAGTEREHGVHRPLLSAAWPNVGG